MRLKEFIETYELYGADDISMITQWAKQEHKEADLISIIGALAQSVAQEKSRIEHRDREWAYYAYCNLVPEKISETDGHIILNAARLAYLGYENDEIFKKKIDKITRGNQEIINLIGGVHPEILKRYREAETSKCEE